MLLKACNSFCDTVDIMSNINALQENRMIHTNDHKTGYLFDQLDHLGPKRRKLMEKSWAGLFREHVLCELPVNEMIPFFTADFGRPTKELYTVLGVLIIQQMQDLTDEQTIYQLAFNEQWHYALDIKGKSDEAAYMSPKTLWNMRKIATDNGLDRLLFEHVTDALAKAFSVDASRQRIDSVHIRSNMRRLGRIRIFAETIHKFLNNLRRHQKDLYGAISQELQDRYMPKEALSCFSMVKPSDSHNTLDIVSADLLELVQCFCGNSHVAAMHSYKLMSRVLSEQCELIEGEVTSRRAKDIPSDSLQNPSDPDATYDGHKGQGYQVQVMETYGDSADGKAKPETLNLITHVAVETACKGDTHALIPAVESAGERNLAPDELLADSHYGSDDNCRAARERGTEVIAPAMGPRVSQIVTLSDFTFTDEGRVIACPRGHAPAQTKHKKTRHTAAFNKELCSHCPLLKDCPVKEGKAHYYLRYDDKAQRLARRRAFEKSDAFRDRYRFRAGIEATMSELDRRTGIKRLRVRGFDAVRFSATLKVIGVNIFRATAVRIARGGSRATAQSLSRGISLVCSFLKEQIYAWWRLFLNPKPCPLQVATF